MSDEARQRAEQVRAAVQAAFVNNATDGEVWDQGLVTGFVLIAEVMGTDGEHYLRTLASPDTPTWWDLGMVEAAAIDMRAKLAE